MQYEHPHIAVSSPAPGHYVITGLQSGSTSTEEGRLIHPMMVHISPEVPSDLLYAIINDRGAVPSLVEEETVVSGVMDSSAADLILAALQERPLRLKELAEKSGVSVEKIKSLSGAGFEVGNGGWVKLQEGGEA